MTDVPALERTQEANFLLYLIEGDHNEWLGQGWRREVFVRHLGTFHFTHSDGYIASELFICSECGRLWGRINYTVRNQPNLHHSFEAVNRPCPEHGEGSFITDIHIEHIRLLPRALLEYEILETNYAGKDRPSSPQRRPSPSGQPNAPHGTARHG